MLHGFQINRYCSILLLSMILVTLSAAISFAETGEKIAWNTILPEEGNLSLQQQRVINTLEMTLTELDSVIDKNIHSGRITYDTDFTLNKDVSIVYDYMAYRIYELMKVDRRIKEELAAQEKALKNDSVSSEAVRQYYSMKTDYEKKGKRFFSSLDSFKRAVLIKDLKAEVKNLRNSIGELRSVMNLYSSYRIAIVDR